MKKRKPLYTVSGIANWSFLKKIKYGTALWPNGSTPGCISKETQTTNLKEYKHSYVHCSFSYNSQDSKATLTDLLKKQLLFPSFFIMKYIQGYWESKNSSENPVFLGFLTLDKAVEFDTEKWLVSVRSFFYFIPYLGTLWLFRTTLLWNILFNYHHIWIEFHTHNKNKYLVSQSRHYLCHTYGQP